MPKSAAPFLYEPLIVCHRKRPFFLDGKKLSRKNGKRCRRYAAAIRLRQNRAGAPALFYILREFLGGVLTVSGGFYQFTYFLQNTGQNKSLGTLQFKILSTIICIMHSEREEEA